MSLLTAAALSKSYGANDIFSGLFLSIPSGARIGLVGANGVGKTTLLHILLGMESPSGGKVIPAKNLRMGYLPQEAVLSTSHTLWEECLGALKPLLEREAALRAMEAAMAQGSSDSALLERYGKQQEEFERQGGYTFEADVERTLTGLGFAAHDFHKPLKMLSGGQRTRAVLARLLLENTDLLMLDEPTNHLDIQAMEWLESYLKSWPGAVVLVSHDRFFLDQTVTVIWEMTPELEVYRGNYSAYLRQRGERYERQMKEYESQQAFIDKENDYIRRNIAGQNTRQAQGRRKRLERLMEEAQLAPPHKTRRMAMRLAAANRSGDLVVRSRDLAVGYADDGKVLLHIPDLELRRGECAAVMGPNGAGKTTFLKTLLGQMPPLGGEILIGANVQVGYFAQAHEGLHPDWTLVQEVQSASPGMLEPEVRDYLAGFLFTGDDAFKQVSVLSGGERGRLALACLALQGANLLLLDEPTNHLDLPSQEILQRVLAEFTGTVLLVSHDRYLVDGLATQIWEAQPGSTALTVFRGNYSLLRAEQAAKSQPEGQAASSRDSSPKKPAAAQMDGKKISQRKLRELEEAISGLEDRLAEMAQKLENPLEAFEPIAELGRQYVDIQAALDAKWEEWHALFQD